jgi:hypothetical protein
MPLGFLFWLLMVLWLLFGVFWSHWPMSQENYRPFGGSLLLFVLLFIIGWKLFGFVIQG